MLLVILQYVNSALGFSLPEANNKIALCHLSSIYLKVSDILHPLGHILDIIQQFYESTMAFLFKIPMKHKI